MLHEMLLVLEGMLGNISTLPDMLMFPAEETECREIHLGTKIKLTHHPNSIYSVL